MNTLDDLCCASSSDEASGAVFWIKGSSVNEMLHRFDIQRTLPIALVAFRSL